MARDCEAREGKDTAKETWARSSAATPERWPMFSLRSKAGEGEGWQVTQGYYKGKLDHNKGMLIKHPFKPGQVISTSDIIDLINQGEDQLIQAVDDPNISKDCP